MGIQEINPVIDEFISLCECTKEPVNLPVRLFDEVKQIDANSLSKEDRSRVLKCVAFFSIHPDPDTSRDSIAYVVDGVEERPSELDYLISELKPMLLGFGSKNKQSGTSQPGLNPKLSYSFDEDENKRKWQENGGLMSIALFYTVLLTMKNERVSVNLNWIIPGIMNLLDDTTDLVNVKLNGVLLLKTFVTHCFDVSGTAESKWITFNQTGMFGMVEPILVNMCYFLPPSHNNSDVILESVYDCLIALYQRNFDLPVMKRYLGDTLLSKVILQYTIPKIGIKYENILEYIIETTTRIVKLLGKESVLYMQRIIYVFGECVVRDPFVTTLKNRDIIPNVIGMLETLVDVCPCDRVQQHRLDFLALVVILYQKYDTEGGVDAALLQRLRSFLAQLKHEGYDLTEPCEELVKAHPRLSVLLQ